MPAARNRDCDGNAVLIQPVSPVLAGTENIRHGPDRDNLQAADGARDHLPLRASLPTPSAASPEMNRPSEKSRTASTRVRHGAANNPVHAIRESRARPSSRLNGDDHWCLPETSSRTPGLCGGPDGHGLGVSGMVRIETKIRDVATFRADCGWDSRAPLRLRLIPSVTEIFCF